MADAEEEEVELTELQKDYRKKRMANPAIYGNPIWEQEGVPVCRKQAVRCRTRCTADVSQVSKYTGCCSLLHSVTIQLLINWFVWLPVFHAALSSLQ